jgi:chromate transporter
LLVGNGYVLLAVLRADLVVKMHWLSHAQLGGDLHGVSAGQMARCGAGNRRDVLAGVCVRGVTAKLLPKSAVASASLDGVSAAAVALMAVVGWQFARAAIVNMPAIVLMVFGAVLVFRYKVNSAWLMLGGAIVGIVLRGIGWV